MDEEAETLFFEMVFERDWSCADQVSVLLKYIQLQDNDQAFIDYLRAYPAPSPSD